MNSFDAKTFSALVSPLLVCHKSQEESFFFENLVKEGSREREICRQVGQRWAQKAGTAQAECKLSLHASCSDTSQYCSDICMLLAHIICKVHRFESLSLAFWLLLMILPPCQGRRHHPDSLSTSTAPPLMNECMNASDSDAHDFGSRERWFWLAWYNLGDYSFACCFGSHF